VLEVDEWQQIRSLHEEGRSDRSIAVALGVSRNTVKKAVAQGEPAHYQRQGSAGSALEGFRPMVEVGLRKGWPGSRLLREVRAHGYLGSPSAFYEWLAGVKGALQAPAAACRFETDPGEQAQFDWSPYRVVLGGQPRVVQVFGMVLGYSRRVHWFPGLSEGMDAIFEAIVACFTHFEGCCRQLVIDNPKAMVAEHGKQGKVVWNDQFYKLCGHYRVKPIACTPRHPQAKGKIENGFQHLEDWVMKDGEWAGLDELEQSIQTFESEWNNRIHGTTKVQPSARFAEERGLLIPLPAQPFPCLVHELREVSKDCLISFAGVRYSVPWVHALGKVRVRLSRGREVVAYDLAGSEIARHRLMPPGSPPQIILAHYAGLKERGRASVATLVSRFHERYGDTGSTAEAFVQHLLAHSSGSPESALGQALELLTGAPALVACAVMADAVALRLTRLDYLQELLRQQLLALAPSARHARGGSVPPSAQLVLPQLDIERPLAGYGQALPPER
jgi:transposase